MNLHLAMHIPDGFLSVPVSAVFWIVSIIFILVSLSRVNRELGERQVPVMGVLAATIFAGQMLNFAVAGGTSGHLMGAALAAILLGPWAAVLVITSVVSVQALIFQDGGLLVLGANIFNMGVVGSFVAFFTYQVFQRLAKGNKWGIFAGGFLAGWLSIVMAALVVAFQLAFSGTSPANITIPAMGGIHILIGIGEGLITAGALSFIYATRRDLLNVDTSKTSGNRLVWLGGLTIILTLAILSPLASQHPDGLEWVAQQAGFLSKSHTSPINLIPNYIFPGISNKVAATIVAGIIGAFIVMGVTVLLSVARRKKTDAEGID